MSKERDKLIYELREIQKNRYTADDVQKRREYMSLMLGHIGDPDPVLRDDLIYNTLCEWIDARDYFGEEQFKRILSVLMDEEHLFCRIGSDGDDSVFTRTFSALGVALVLSRHRRKAVFSAGEIARIRDRSILYYTSEKDFRGYVEGRGGRTARHTAPT